MRAKLPEIVTRAVLGTASHLARLAASAVVWLLAFGILGLGSIVSGVAVLFGLGWALIAAGAAFLVAAAFIKQGLSNG